MGIFKGLFQREEPQEAYCQYCGTDITSEGGDINGEGKIFCNGYKPDGSPPCDVRDAFQNITVAGIQMISNFYHPKEVQKAIKRGELTEFGPLERAADSDS